VAYLFNIVNEPQITDLYFHNVLHCAACQCLRVYIIFTFWTLFHLEFIKFELHNYGSKVTRPGSDQCSVQRI